MSSRIEKGGARFKPSIVQRRSAAASTAPTVSAPSGSPSTSSPAAQQQQRRPSVSGSASSPTLSATSAFILASPSLRPTLPPSIGGPSASSVGSSSKSFAFTLSPARINLNRSNVAPASDQTGSSPAFRRPSVSRQAPGLRNSATPGPSRSVRTPSIPPISALPSSAAILDGSGTAAVEAADNAESLSSEPRSLQPPAIGSSRPSAAKGKPFTVGSSRVNDSDDEAQARLNAPPAIQRIGTTRNAGEMLPPPWPSHGSGPQGTKAAPSSSNGESTNQQIEASIERSTRSKRKTAATGVAESSTSSTDGTAPVLEESAAPAQETDNHVSSKKRKVSVSQRREDAPHETVPAAASNNSSMGPPAPIAGRTRSSAAPSTRARSKSNGKGRAMTDNGESDEDDDGSGEEGKLEREARRAKRDAARMRQKLKDKEHALGKPKRPASAYLLFMNSVRAEKRTQLPDLPLVQLTSIIAGEWRQLSGAVKQGWEAKAMELKKQYERVLVEWEIKYPDGVELGESDDSEFETSSEVDESGNKIRRRRARGSRHAGSRQKRTVSDDEREYMEQVEAEGYTLASSRLDPSRTLMGEISSVNYKKGRAGPRTFELDRVRRKQEEERKAVRHSQQTGAATPKRANASPTPEASGPSPFDRISDSFIEGEEEIVGEDEDEDNAASAEEAPATRTRDRRRAPSIAGTEHSFSENRFAVQTRIVDGRIVVDETSLFANYGNGEDDRDGMEVIDEREGDRFVNSATRGKGAGRLKKWSQEDTAKFFKAVQQWGTDFEMISRLFPGRDRVVIKKKWNIEERANPRMVDDALNNRLAIDLDAYALAAGVDLSGPPPVISADLGDIGNLTASAEDLAKVKKHEGTAPESGLRTQEEDEDDYEFEEEIEIDEHGNETVIRKRLGKKPASKKRKSRKNQVQEPAADPTSAPALAAASLSTSGAVEPNAMAESSQAGGADVRPPTIGTRSRRQRGNSIASSNAAGARTAAETRARRMSRSDANVVDREKRHRASTLRGSEVPTDRMEVEEIIGDA